MRNPPTTASAACCRSAATESRAAEAGFTLIELLAVIASIGVLIGLLVPAVQAVREAARRAMTESTLNAVALTVQSNWSLQVPPNTSYTPNAFLTLGFTLSNSPEPVGTTFRPCLQINCIAGTVITGTYDQTFVLDPADFGPETLYSVNAEADFSPGANIAGGDYALLTWTGQPQLTYTFVDIPEPSTIFIMCTAIAMLGMAYRLSGMWRCAAGGPRHLFRLPILHERRGAARDPEESSA